MKPVASILCVMDEGALSGFTVAVTADRRAEEQMELLARHGSATVHAPVIRTRPLSDGAGLRAATLALIETPPEQVLVCTALGLRGWCSAADSFGLLDGLHEALRHTQMVARGPKAAGAVQVAGLGRGDVVIAADYRELTGLLSERERPARLAIVLDGAGSLPVVVAAADHGHDVVPVPVYRWHLPTDPAPALRLVSSICDCSIDAVTFTSAHAVANLFLLAERAGRGLQVRGAFGAGAVTAVAVGPITAAELCRRGVPDPVVPASPRLGAMVQALAAAFDERQREVRVRGHRLRIRGRLVWLDDVELASLTDRERAVLQVLADRGGGVVSKRSLMLDVWGDGGGDHVVEVTVARLRRRLGPVGDSIETVMRRGYRLAVEPELQVTGS